MFHYLCEAGSAPAVLAVTIAIDFALSLFHEDRLRLGIARAGTSSRPCLCSRLALSLHKLKIISMMRRNAFMAILAVSCALTVEADDFGARVDSLLGSGAMSRSTTSVAVYDLTDGRELYSHNAGILRGFHDLPGSLFHSRGRLYGHVRYVVNGGLFSV